MDAEFVIPDKVKIPSADLSLHKHEYLSLLKCLQSPEVEMVQISSKENTVLDRKTIVAEVQKALIRVNASLPHDQQIKPKDLNRLVHLIPDLHKKETSPNDINQISGLFLKHLYLTEPVENRPGLAQLTAWQQEMTQAQIKTSQDLQEKTIQTPETLSLQAQISYIQKLKQGAEGVIGSPEYWQKLDPGERAEKRRGLEKIAQSIARDIVNQREAEGEGFNPSSLMFVWDSIDQACKESPDLNKAFPKKIRESLAQGIAQKISQEAEEAKIAGRPEGVHVLISSQEKINQTAGLATSRADLVEKIVEKTGVTEKKAREIATRLERNRPSQSLPTSEQVKKAILKSLDWGDQIGIYQKGSNPNKVINNLSSTVNIYYQGYPHSKKLPWNKSVSERAYKLAEKYGIKSAYAFVAQYLLDGQNFKEIGQIMAGWESKGFSQKKAAQLKKQLTEAKLPLFTRWRVKWTSSISKIDRWRKKANIRTNPLTAGFWKDPDGFWKHYSSKLSIPFSKRVNKFKTRVSESSFGRFFSPFSKRINKFKIKVSESPFGRFFAPFSKRVNKFKTGVSGFRLKRFFSPRQNFRLWRKSQKQKTANRWHNFVKNRKSEKWRKFFHYLPEKLRLSYWTGLPNRLLRKAGAKALNRLGFFVAKTFGKVALGKLLQTGGDFLLKNGFKKLLSKGTAFAIGAVLGIGGGPVGMAINIVAGIGKLTKRLVLLLFSPHAREAMKKTLELAAKALTTGIMFLGKIMSAYPFATAGVIFGGFFGGAGGVWGAIGGAALWGTIGYLFDITVGSWLKDIFGTRASAGAISARIGSGPASLSPAETAGLPAGLKGSGLAAKASPALSMAKVGALSAKVGVLGTVGATAVLNVTTYINNNSAFIHPANIAPPAPGSENPPPWESIYVGVEKEADQTQFSNEDLAGNPQVTYTITITPREGEITINGITDEITLYSRQSGLANPTLTLSSGNNPEGETISSPVSFNYTMTLNQTYEDTRIRNSINVAVTAEDGTPDEATAYATIVIGDPPGIGCPILPEYSPYISCRSYFNPVGNCHHGANGYWDNNENNCDNYRIPAAFDQCWGPLESNRADPGGGGNNICYDFWHDNNQDNMLCADYGKALDVAAPADTPVVLPSIDGNSTTWTYIHTYQTDWGRGHIFETTVGTNVYWIYIAHINEAQPNCSSCETGEVLGTIYHGAEFHPHIHIELQINGQYEMPEDFICQDL